MTIAPVTLSEEEYRALGDDACNQIKRLVEANLHETWPHIEWDEPDLKVYGRKCVEFEEAHENMLMLVTTLQTSIVKVERLLFPWFDYRVKWDEMLDRADIADKFSQETYVVRHVVKKRLTLAARDAIDATKVNRDSNGTVIMGSTGSSHGHWPPQEGFVRTKQFLGGYYLKPLSADKTQFNMIFCADLNLPIPRFLSNMVAKLKPRLMVEKTKNLAKAIDKYKL